MKVVLRSYVGIVMVAGITATVCQAQVASVASHKVTIRRLAETRSYAPATIQAVSLDAIGAREVLQVRSNERHLKVVLSLFQLVDGVGTDVFAARDWRERSRQFYSAESWIRPRRLQTLTLAELAPAAPAAITRRDADRQRVVLTITR